MRKIGLLFLIWAALFVLSCSNALSDKDRKSLESNVYTKFFTCDKTFYTFDERGLNDTSSDGQLLQFENLTVIPTSLPLDSADSGNKVEYREAIELKFTRVRPWNSINKKWGEWKSSYDFPSISAVKQNGEWKVLGLEQFTSFYFGLKKLEKCEDIQAAYKE